MIMKLRYISLLILFVAINLQAQNPKAKKGTFALTNASIETVTKGVINNGTVIIRDGKIEAVGTNVQVPQGAEVIDCKGSWIYPGFIESGSKIGLFEFGLFAQATDASEIGDLVPQVKALTAV